MLCDLDSLCSPDWSRYFLTVILFGNLDVSANASQVIGGPSFVFLE